jgi:hypothetical protein
MEGNLGALIAAGLIKQEHVTAEEQALIEKLTPEEVQAIISAHKKIGTENIKKISMRGAIVF